ncbi:MAG: AraC family transcriptional regulator [Opitutaceae bacterium]|nr:AraC family transcriptional regulator [Opitutaceae bacterium]
MNIFRQLRRQMRVVSNPKHREDLGGFHLNFVGVGRRKFSYTGWWQTRLNFYVIDASCFRQRVRIPEKNREFMRESNFVVLYAPNTLYEEHCSGTMEFNDAWIVFRAATRFNPLDALVRRNGYCLFRDEGGLVRHHIEEASMIANANAGLRWVASAAFLRILALLHHALPSAEGHPRVIHPLAYQRAQSSEFQERVLRVLKDNLGRNVSVDELARRMGLSRSTLTHRFSLEMGDTLARTKNRLRIERAQEWIGTTDKPFKEISFALGFDDPAYFSRVFQDEVGVSPRDYRRLVDSASYRGNSTETRRNKA